VSDDELVARINMADAKFSFQEKGKIYQPAWVAPEVQVHPHSYPVLLGYVYCILTVAAAL
jgi:hypothetical protein